MHLRPVAGRWMLPKVFKYQIDLASVRSSVPNLSQYFNPAAPWMIEPAAASMMLQQVQRMNLMQHVETQQAAGANHAASHTQRGDSGSARIAIIDIRGVMTKEGSSMSEAGATVMARREVRMAANDDAIDAILLRIDSPGGSSAGVADLAADVSTAASVKPVYAFCEDTCASAAYWVASQAVAVFANNSTAQIGSIGTYIGLYDMSEMAKKDGIEAVLIRSGSDDMDSVKGLGFPGTQIDETQRVYLKTICDKLQAEFSAGVAAGRDMKVERVQELADGRVHLAVDALGLGMIDGIQSLDLTLEQLAAEVRNGSGVRRGRTPSASGASGLHVRANSSEQWDSAVQFAGFPNDETEPKATKDVADDPKPEQNTMPATLTEIKKAIPTAAADNDFLVSCIEQELEIEACKDAWIDHQQKAIDASNAELEEAKQKQAAPKKPGVKGINQGRPQSTADDDDDAEFGDPVESYNAAVRKKVDGGMDRLDACAAVNRANPELHSAYLKATNAKKAHRLIDDKFDE